LAGDVKAAGISTINGDVLVDDGLWNPFVTKEGVVTSIMVNDNLMDVLVTPGAAEGDPVNLRTIPETKFFTVDNRATTGAPGGVSTAAVTLGADNKVTVTGNLPIRSPQLDLAQFAPNPAAYVRAGLFIEAPQRAGAEVSAPLEQATGTVPADSAYNDGDELPSLTSAPAGVLTKLVLKISDNRGAETLLCLLALKAGSRDCDSGGMPVVIEHFAEAGIEPGSVEIYDGEGSDPASATPAAMVTWLTWLDKQPFGPVVRDGLPDIEHDGKILVKSGLSARPEIGAMPAMFVAGGQAGYVTTASGKNLVVSIYALNGIYPTVSQGLGGNGQDIDYHGNCREQRRRAQGRVSSAPAGRGHDRRCRPGCSMISAAHVPVADRGGFRRAAGHIGGSSGAVAGADRAQPVPAGPGRGARPGPNAGHHRHRPDDLPPVPPRRVRRRRVDPGPRHD
jgi:D-alanyl-D-alanine carboxypeptidase/D-alanyl-D-alanine-endopeptidase (penicillin-binding protein 4)